MKKKLAVIYLSTIIAAALFIVLFLAYEINRHGFIKGLYLSGLVWSAYVLCVPAAHGRIYAKSITHFIFGDEVQPEVLIWTVAVAFNIITLSLFPGLYAETIFSHVLYRIFFNQSYWIILLVATVGTWYRTTIGSNYAFASSATHTIIRHLWTMVGVFLLCYLTLYDVIIMLNTTVTG
jgi:hypothetical protein